MSKHTMINEHPMNLARAMAKMLQADRIATAQVKEHIPQEELIDLLDITPPEFESVEEMVRVCGFTESQLRDYLGEDEDPEEKPDLWDYTDREVEQMVRGRLTRTQLLNLAAAAA
jgi:hypothetical protein